MSSSRLASNPLCSKGQDGPIGVFVLITPLTFHFGSKSASYLRESIHFPQHVKKKVIIKYFEISTIQ